MSDSFLIDNHELFVSASIGVSLFPAHGADVETLVRNADTAMYRAKEAGRSRCQVYSQSLNAGAVDRMKLESGLRKAVLKDELVLHYQPRVDILTGHTVGVEALVRWQHPELGLLFPDQFVSLAEGSGLIVEMTEWIIRTACAQNKAWQDAGHPALDVAVNISARHFQHGNLVTTVQEALDRSGLVPQSLCLELTETALIANPEVAAGILRKLKEIGTLVAVDDFGVGHSSLNYLKRFPIDSVKIDRSFIRDVSGNPDDAAIAEAIVAMAHSLKLKVVAEGVENLEQLDFLRSLNCDEMQGYFVSRPLPPESLNEILLGVPLPPAKSIRLAA